MQHHYGIEAFAYTTNDLTTLLMAHMPYYVMTDHRVPSRFIDVDSSSRHDAILVSCSSRAHPV